ncbi:helix-turn-helix transcriptional regulator [Candidatus Gottesmanbacteria bacterium]|nr:helix-turn-helix transcriptional regulator [Candidatus Gottesmanbacteria bacterium]
MSELIVKIFKSLSDPTRYGMIKFLLTKQEFSCKELSKKFSLSQPALSHHFSKLISAKIINVRKNGTENYYSINDEYLKEIGIDINKIIKKGNHL